MRRLVIRTVLLAVLIQTSASAVQNSGNNTPVDPHQQITVSKNLTSMPLAFTENQGQWDDQVKFRANAGGATMWFTETGAYYQFTRPVESEKSPARPINPMRELHHEPQPYETMLIKASFVGANPNPQVVGEGELEYKCNYIIGNDPNEWHTDVPNYEAIVLEEVYEGIDLKYHGNGSQMEYDFLVEPGADFSLINIAYEGAESVSINAKGELVVETKWGVIIEQRPVIYQIKNDTRIAIAGEYYLEGANAFGFELSKYDSTLPLVIDPILSYSTYLGGGEWDVARGIAIDASGAAYVTGYTDSHDFPTLNPYQDTYQGGNYDIFVTKLSGSGNSLVYSTYLGGSDADYGAAIAVDASGTAFITGTTFSTDFPMLNPYQGTHRGGIFDAYVTRLASSGNSLIYSTYLGGSDRDRGFGIAVDASGAAHVAGDTQSTDFPTVNGYQGTFQGSGTFGGDAFVTKLSGNGSSLGYSTYLGGSDSDYGFGIALDDSGAAYVTGYTCSTDFPTLNPYQGTNHGDITDAFASKLSSSGNSLVYSTYLGGSGNDVGDGIAVDASGAAYVTGNTYSTDFPTLNPYQGTHHGGETDAFITKLSSSGTGLVYSTYFGGIGGDYGSGIATDASGATYVTGMTRSIDFPTHYPYQGASQDAFVLKLGSSGTSLIHSSRLGGGGSEYGYGIAIDSDGATYVTGTTGSIDLPTQNPYLDTHQGGNLDAFVAKLSPICADSDGDGYGDPGHSENECPEDNCPYDVNPDQEDDGDPQGKPGNGIGDVCDCCSIRVGDVNNSGDDDPTIGDVAMLIDVLFIMRNCSVISCVAEADINQSGGLHPECDDVTGKDLTIGDVAELVDYLFITGPQTGVLRNCL